MNLVGLLQIMCAVCINTNTLRKTRHSLYEILKILTTVLINNTTQFKLFSIVQSSLKGRHSALYQWFSKCHVWHQVCPLHLGLSWSTVYIIHLLVYNFFMACAFLSSCVSLICLSSVLSWLRESVLEVHPNGSTKKFYVLFINLLKIFFSHLRNNDNFSFIDLLINYHLEFIHQLKNDHF